MYLNEIYSNVRIGENLRNMFPIQNDLKQGNAESPLLFVFGLEYAIRKVLQNRVELKLNRGHQILVYFKYVNLL
jgi:hypothetical protein